MYDPMSLLLNQIGIRINRKFFAKKEPTQHLMDEAVRVRDPYYLPWRIVHLVKASRPSANSLHRSSGSIMRSVHNIVHLQVWTFTLVLWPVVPLVAAPALAYYAVSFLIDRPNMLTILEPLPPSSGASERYNPSSQIRAGLALLCTGSPELDRALCSSVHAVRQACVISQVCACGSSSAS